MWILLSGFLRIIIVKIDVFVEILFVCGVIEFVVIIFVFVFFLGGYNGILFWRFLFILSFFVFFLVKILVFFLVSKIFGRSLFIFNECFFIFGKLLNVFIIFIL